MSDPVDRAQEGWGYSPGNSRKWHYFKADGMSLCRKIGFYRGDTEVGNDNSEDNCAQCRRLLERRPKISR
jgi:hypothetical protein